MTEFRCPFCNGELELKAKQEPKKPFRYPKEFIKFWYQPHNRILGKSKREMYEIWKDTQGGDVIVFEPSE